VHLIDEALIVDVHISEPMGKTAPNLRGKRGWRGNVKAPNASGDSKKKILQCFVWSRFGKRAVAS
jgi:hypothetical protein